MSSVAFSNLFIRFCEELIKNCQDNMVNIISDEKLKEIRNVKYNISTAKMFLKGIISTKGPDYLMDKFLEHTSPFYKEILLKDEKYFLKTQLNKYDDEDENINIVKKLWNTDFLTNDNKEKIWVRMSQLLRLSVFTTKDNSYDHIRSYILI